MTTIIGVDPGSRFTGFGVIRGQGMDWQHIDHGVIDIPERFSFAQRLAYLALHLRPVWSRWPQATTVVERVFLGRNVDSAFKLGHARGVCLYLAAEAGSPVVEYAARSVKKVVTGHGGADKEHVKLIVTQILKIAGSHLAVDASDALALALCHGHTGERLERIKKLQENQL